MEKKTQIKKLNVVDWILWLTIAGVIIGVGSLILSIYGLDAQDSTRWTTDYAVNQDMSIIETRVHWQPGNLYYGVNQVQGTVQTRYSIYYKKNSGSYVLEFPSGYCNANNTFYGEWFMHSTNGIDKYTYKLIKDTNKNVASKMIVDLMLPY